MALLVGFSFLSINKAEPLTPVVLDLEDRLDRQQRNN